MTDKEFLKLSFNEIENITGIDQEKYAVVWQVKSLNTRKMIIAIIGDTSEFGDFIEVSLNIDTEVVYIDFYDKKKHLGIQL